MDYQMIGNQIALLRRGKGLTQNELGERLGVSYQAVSKWERGEGLPDAALLLPLAQVLETTVDNILSGGERSLGFRGRVRVGDLREGLLCLKRMGELLGREHPLYRHAIAGINEKMNTDMELAFLEDNAFEAFLAESILLSLLDGKYVDITDVKTSFRSEHFRDMVLRFCAEHGMQ